MANLHLLALFFIHMHVTLCMGRRAPSKFPAILIFGDSTVDTGNNNYLPTAGKANFPPYGINFANHTATGRFSDGSLVPDFLSDALGIKESVPPFLDPKLTDADIRTGVCFASAGAGYDEQTSAGKGILPVLKQLDLFKQYMTRLQKVVGNETASQIANHALIAISAGSNDFLLNYYKLPERRKEFDVYEYQDFLLQKLQTLVEGIYNLGGRRFAIANVPPFGCAPKERITQVGFKCVDEHNAAAVVYNSKFEILLPKIQSRLAGSKIAYMDLYNPVIDMINNRKKYGFMEVSRGCCGTGVVELGILCGPASPYCADPSKFLFWDSVHPTEVAYQVLAKIAMDKVIPLLRY